MKLKTLFVLSFTLLIVFLIYLSHIDKKVYYVALGDYQALGVTNEGIITYGYSDYLKDRLRTNNKLETYLIGYAKDNARITDVINDIEQNRELKIKSRKKMIDSLFIFSSVYFSFKNFVWKERLLKLPILDILEDTLIS